MPAPKEPRKGKPWHHAKQSRHERGYDSRWVKLRKVIIARDCGLCQPCLRKGRPTPYHAVDHIKPKSMGGTDDPANLECICEACHDAKTNKERDEAQQELDRQGKRYVDEDGWPVEPKVWGFDVPHGLQPSGCRVVVVCGPPASGKTTYVREHAGPRDRIIDLDEIKVMIGGKMWDQETGVIKRALAWRDKAIRSLSLRTDGTAWLIVTGGSPAARAAWLEALGPFAELVVIDTPKDTCAARINADPARRDGQAAMHRVLAAWQ